MSDDKLLDVIKCAKEYFANGIYVPCNQHPCGWDFISFENIDLLYTRENPLKYKFQLSDISDYAYDEHNFENCTLGEILEERGKFAFEKESIDWI